MKFSHFLNEANNIGKGTYFCFKSKDGRILYGVTINQLVNGYIAFSVMGLMFLANLEKRSLMILRNNVYQI